MVRSDTAAPRGGRPPYSSTQGPTRGVPRKIIPAREVQHAGYQESSKCKSY